MSFKGNRLLAKAVRAKQRHDEAMNELHIYLKDKIEFDFAIDHQPGDGHTIIDVDSGLNIAPVDVCLSVIYNKGILSRKDHKNLCI